MYGTNIEKKEKEKKRIHLAGTKCGYLNIQIFSQLSSCREKFRGRHFFQ